MVGFEEEVDFLGGFDHVEEVEFLNGLDYEGGFVEEVGY